MVKTNDTKCYCLSRRDLSIVTFPIDGNATISDTAATEAKFLLKYDDSHSMRRKGRPNLYKLIRKRVIRFEAIINAI